jgi:hypothetical protein
VPLRSKDNFEWQTLNPKGLGHNVLNLLRHLQEAELFVFSDLKFCQTVSYLTACEFPLSKMKLDLDDEN